MRLSEELRRAAEPVWQAQHDHPFVRAIGDGTLEPERFHVWVRQDWLFLTEYARLLALGAARAPDLDTMRRFAELAHATLHDEMALHRSYAADLGVGESELDAEEMLPTTRAYTDFLLRVATLGDYAELVAALLPCMWGYSEVGRELDSRGRPPDAGYARFVEMYAGEDFAELAGWCCELMDRVGHGHPQPARLREAFLTSSRYELAFWEMAWSGEEWAS